MITIFTEPSLYPWFQVYKFCKNVIKRIIGKEILPYSGHFAVMRSIITGLSELDVPFVYNPAVLKYSYQHIHVFANVSALKMAIFLKKIRVIKYLSVGPNLVISSADENGILASKYIDKVVLNSDWVRDAYLRDNNKLLPHKVVIWPAGVDVKYWHITKTMHTDKPNFLFYIKTIEGNLIEECERITLQYNINVSKIFYGSYALEQLKNMLIETDCVVYFSGHESQGIGLSEIWATDTPTFAWNRGVWTHSSKNYKSSSAPYLTPQVGMFFTNETDFEKLVSDFCAKKNVYRPREYVVENFTDLISAKDFLKKIDYSN